MRLVALLTPSNLISYAEKYLTYLEVPRGSPPLVYWFWGPTGSGKSRAAAAESVGLELGEVYWHQGGPWFDGLDGHAVMVMDEFRPKDRTLSSLLKLLDRYPFRVPNKGGFRQMKCTHIFITCPRHPENCYLDEGEDNAQLIRRIHEIREFRNEE